MKKIITILCAGMIIFSASAQSNSVTAGAGFLNTKVRVQFEHGFSDMHSAGANLGLYFQLNTGQRLEGFYRIYVGGDNERGMFIQASGGAGQFSYFLDEVDQISYTGFNKYNEGDKFITFGGGIAFGGKITTGGGFVFESTLGGQLWTPPHSNFTEEFTEAYPVEALEEAANVALFYLGPGFPLMFQMKFGFNF